MENRQLDHHENINDNNKYPVSILLDNITNQINVGSIFRLCDALGVEKVYLCGESILPPHRLIKKASRSAEKYIDFENEENAIDTINELKNDGYTIIALEITTMSKSIKTFNFSCLEKICVVVGCEQHGVQQDILDIVDYSVHIPMYGNNSSMNLSNAVSIALYEVTKQLD